MFKNKLENYDRTATECVLRAERMIVIINDHLKKTKNKSEMSTVLGELLYNYRLEIIKEQQQKTSREKRSFSEGLQSAIKKAAEQYVYLTLGKEECDE